MSFEHQFNEENGGDFFVSANTSLGTVFIQIERFTVENVDEDKAKISVDYHFDNEGVKGGIDPADLPKEEFVSLVEGCKRNIPTIIQEMIGEST